MKIQDSLTQAKKIRQVHGHFKGFQSISRDTDLITEKLLNNDSLCKLLYYNDDTPLEKPILTDEQRFELIETEKIRSIPNVFAGENKGSYLIIVFDTFMPSSNPEFLTIKLKVDIVCHLDTWAIVRDKMRATRPYEIAHEVKQVIDGQSFSGIGRALFLGAETILNGADTNYGGVSMEFVLMNHNDPSVSYRG